MRRQLAATGSTERTPSTEAIAALVHAAAAGDAGAWKHLVERFSGLVWSIARSYRLNATDAADVSQVVWLRLIEHLERIREPDRLGAWLASVTRHECLRVLKTTEREITIDQEFDVTQESAEDAVDLRMILDDRDAALWRAFDALPARWRAMLHILMYSPSTSYDEVSEALGMPVGSIGPTRQRCLERLRASPELAGIAAGR